jgi:preprotein translocase subunit SecD
MHAAVLNDFAAALIDPARDVPEFITSYTAHRPPKRFAVYRNNVASSLINALRTRFPATEKIVGDEFFAAMAHLFITGNLPRSPVLMFYGDAYPDFIAGFEPARELPYLPDVARLEAARTHAYHAADAVPFGAERFLERSGQPVIVKKQVILTGENLTDAQPGFDSQTQEAVVNLTLDAKGARIFRDVTRESIGKRMAIVLFEKGKGEVVTAPVIRSEISGGRVQISGRMTAMEATDTALLLRAGSLAAPMEIIEERTIGPSLGAENIAKGFHSVTWGFAAVAVFMCLYYLLFGVFSSVALAVNLLLLVAILSMLQATLTLPGMAAMALVLGMAIDANVLINERVREELRNGASAQAAIHAGYDRAWATILDSNVTTLIAGLALLTFGSGPVRGFAVVHVLGILTSMFSGVFFSRGLVNLWYGRQNKLKSVSIGTVWRPESGTQVKSN